MTDLEEGLLGDEALLLLLAPLAPAPEVEAPALPPHPPPPLRRSPPPRPPARPPPTPRVVTQPVHNVTADPIQPYAGRLLPADRALDWTLAGYRGEPSAMAGCCSWRQCRWCWPAAMQVLRITLHSRP